MKKTKHLGLLVWSVIIISTFVSFTLIIVKGLSLDTSIMSLLPNKQTTPALTEATDKFIQEIGEKVIFLISAKDEKQAIDATQTFSKILEESNRFREVNTGVDENQQMSWGAFYFPYRLQLLSPKNQKLLEAKNYDKITQNALVSIYSPMGIGNRKLLDNDPFFFYQNYLLTLPKPSSNLNLNDGYLMIEHDNRYYILVQTRIKGNSFSLDIQKHLLDVITNATSAVQKDGVEVLRTGMLFYAHEGAESAQKEVKTIGVGSLIGILLLILLTFKSLRPLFFTIISVGCGFIAAFVVTYLLFGNVFLFTLVFGASLIGISVDYAFFYYSERLLAGNGWTAQKGLKKIFWAITLGLFNVILAFAVISVAPFPGLHQLAVFAITGLFVSYLTVICLFPYIMSSYSRKNPLPILLKLTNMYLDFWRVLSKKVIIIMLVAITTIIAIGLAQIRANDDIHILESTSPELKSNELAIKKLIGSDIGLDFIVVLAENDEKLLEKAVATTTAIRNAFPNIDKPLISISDYVPSQIEQKDNYKQIQSLLETNELNTYLQQIGYSDAQANDVKKTLLSIEYKPLELSDWLKAPASKQLQFLWLGKQQDGQKALAIVVSKDIGVKHLEGIADTIDGVYLVDKVGQINDIFSHYRVMIMYMLALVIGLLWIGMILRYSFKQSLVYVLVPILSCLASISVFGLFGIPLTLFSVLAMMLVLGISMDYVIFLAESHDDCKATMLALSLSAITTILSFGLLSLSDTPAIHYFGLTVLVGIVLAFLISPIAIKVKKDEN